MANLGMHQYNGNKCKVYKFQHFHLPAKHYYMTTTKPYAVTLST